MHDTDLIQIWVYLAATPLLGLTITLLAYVCAYAFYQYCRASPLANPVAVAVLLLIGVLTLTHTSYRAYFDGAKFVHFLLGPATVALAIPLYKQLANIRRLLFPLLTTLVLGVLWGSLSSVLMAHWLGASKQVSLSLAPKSVTAPVAMSISEHIGGLPALTAALVVSTGIIGAVIGTRLLQWCRIYDHAVMGVALGITAHGIGTSRAFQVSTEMGAFAGLSMALAAFVTSVLVPWLVGVLGCL